MSDIAIGLDALIPGAAYRGSLTDNTQASFDALVWLDARSKPTWTAVESAANESEQPTSDDVRAEAARRMIAVVGARDKVHLDIIISNGTREAVRLLRAGPASWTPEQAERADALAMVDTLIESIRTASNTLEATSPIPDDFKDSSYWNE